MSDQRNGFSEDIVNVVRGLCMGAADIVPGVSGGTIALILGHYERLVTAIGNIGGDFVKLLLERKFAQAAAHIDLRFLIGLVIGIGTGIIALASLMHYLLEYQQAYTYAAFTGLILCSSYLVAQRLKSWKWFHVPIAFVGAFAAWQICKLSPIQGELTPLNAFLAATVAICAMILPGISGAFVLLLLGLYHPITQLIKNLVHLETSLTDLTILVCFGLGCGVGLLSFTRLLKWLLAHRHDGTMALLAGLMLGSLVKIWPFQRVVHATQALPFKERQFENILPSESPANLTWVVAIAVLAFLATLGLEQLGHFAVKRDQPAAGD